MRLPNKEARIGVELQGVCAVLRLGLPVVCQCMQSVSVSAAASIVLYILYWVSNLDSSLSPSTVGVVWVCAFYSTLYIICTVEMLLKNQVSLNA
jgi:hypothetical protein